MVGDSLPQWMQDLIAGWPVIKANLPTFFVILLLMVGAVWIMFNWSYGSIVANKDSEIALLKGQRDDYKDKLNGATPDQAKAKIESLETRLAALEPRLAAIEPRRLTAQQRAAMIARLSPQGGTHPTIEITGEAAGDSPQFAADFASVFRSAGGWNIIESQAMGIGGRPASGIALTVSSMSSPEVQVVTNALRAANIDFEIRQGVLREGISIALLVCTKIIR